MDITSENARTLAQTRWKKYQQAAADALTEELGSVSPGSATPFSVWGLLVADQATKLIDYQKPRVKELQHLGQIIGAVAGPNEAGAAASGEKDSHYREFVRDLADLVRARE